MIMRSISLGLIIAFLWTTMHAVVDHGTSGEGHEVFFPHASPSDLHEDDHAIDMHHQQDDGDEHASAPHAGHRHADTHSHFAWYTSASTPDVKRPMSLVHAVPTGLALHPVASPSFLRVNIAFPLLLRVCLPLWCRVLLI